MATKRQTKCKAPLEVPDYASGNLLAKFTCGLPRGHAGPHTCTGAVSTPRTRVVKHYVLCWEEREHVVIDPELHAIIASALEQPS